MSDIFLNFFMIMIEVYFVYSPSSLWLNCFGPDGGDGLRRSFVWLKRVSTFLVQDFGRNEENRRMEKCSNEEMHQGSFQSKLCTLKIRWKSLFKRTERKIDELREKASGRHLHRGKIKKEKNESKFLFSLCQFLLMFI